MKNTDKKKETKELIENSAEAAIQLIPYVGGSLSTLYFGRKNARRMARLESFYLELAEEIRAKEVYPIPISEQNDECLTDLIETINTKVEADSRRMKVQCFKKAFINILTTPSHIELDEKISFLHTLDLLSEYQCYFLASEYRSDQFSPLAFRMSPEETYKRVGAAGQLKTFGFLRTRPVGGAYDEEAAWQEMIRISIYGKKFVEFCISY